jgi:hypothetical protein
MFDTGFSFSQVPKYGQYVWVEKHFVSSYHCFRSIADKIYSRIPGSKFENLTQTGPIWTLPCNVEVNTTLFFGNKAFPIHPFDMNFSIKNSSGDQICIGGVCMILARHPRVAHRLIGFSSNRLRLAPLQILT